MPIMPISDELHDLVGNPVPSGDLGQRARDRAGEIKRRRMAGIVTSVVAVSVLAVPGALLVRDQSSVRGAAGGGSAEPTPAATSATGVLSTVATKVVPQPQEPSAADKARFASALTLLGRGFTRTGAGIVIDTKTGKQVGTSAIFTATDSGGVVGVEWTLASGSTTGGSAVVAPTDPLSAAQASKQQFFTAGSAAGGGYDTEQGSKQASAGPIESGSADGLVTSAVTGTVTQNGKLQISVKVVQGKAGSPEILPGKAAVAFANDLLKASR